MSLITFKKIPGAYGMTFITDAIEHENLIKVKSAILNVNGVDKVLVNKNETPKQLNVFSSIVISAKKVENAAINTGFKAIAQSIFPATE